MSFNLMPIGAAGGLVDRVGVWTLLRASVSFVVNSVNMESGSDTLDDMVGEVTNCKY